MLPVIFYNFNKRVAFTVQALNNVFFIFFSSWIPPGVSMKIKFIRNSDDFVILANEPNGTYKIKLLELFVEFRKITADTQILRREMQALENGDPYIMPFLQGKQVIHTIPKGRHSYMLQDLFSGPLPKQVLISFVSHESFNGTLKTNPFIFENLKINSLVFKMNGENSPPREYKPNFTSTPLDCVRGNIH